jgi:uncharacterized protein DUF4349
MGRVWIGLALAAAVVVGCSQTPEGGGGAGGGGGGAVPLPDESGAAGGGDIGSAAPIDLPPIGPSVIKTADLQVEVDGLDAAMDGATRVATRYGGFVVSSATEGEESQRGSVMIRVPSDRFEEALGDLRGLGEVQRQRVEGQDMSQEFVDLEARLRNLDAQETVLLGLFKDAVSVTDTIRVQRELSGVQLQIEELQGRLRYLRDRTALGTITVGLAGAGAAAPGPLDEALDRAVQGFLNVLAGLVVALGYVAPFAIIGLAGLLGYRRFRPRSMRLGSTRP